MQALEGLDPDTLSRLESDLTTVLHAMGVADDAPAMPIAQM